MKKFCFKLLLLIEILCYSSLVLAVVPEVRRRDLVANSAIVAAPVSSNAAGNAIAVSSYKSETEKWNETKKTDTSQVQSLPKPETLQTKQAPPVNLEAKKPVVLAPELEMNNPISPETKVIKLSKVNAEKKELTTEEQIRNRKIKEAKFVNELMTIDYQTQAVPRGLYDRKFTEYNNHIPPVYFKSYYLSLAFKAAKENDLNGINAVFKKYNFLNGQNKDGDTILMYAIQNNSLKAARLLLAKGAYVNAVNSRKRTALHYASAIGNLDLVKLLLTMGADYRMRDDLGMTPIDYAEIAKQFHITEMIKQYNRKE